MSAQVWYLLALVPVIAVAYVIWSYRKRVGERESARHERYVSLIGAQHGGGTAAAADKKEQAAPPPTSQPATRAAQPVVQPAARRERFLTQPETLLYYVLKAGLPEHEIFPRVSLAAVMEATEKPSPHASGDAWSSRQILSFAICNKSMQVVAVVQLDDGPAGRQEMEAMNQRLSAAGVRLVRVSTAALPRREQVKSLVLGLAA